MLVRASPQFVGMTTVIASSCFKRPANANGPLHAGGRSFWATIATARRIGLGRQPLVLYVCLNHCDCSHGAIYGDMPAAVGGPGLCRVLPLSDRIKSRG